jgi:hypothetical protein
MYKKMKHIACLILCIAMAACINSNALKQSDAEKTIRTFVSENNFDGTKEVVNEQAIKEIGETNIYTQYNTSVRTKFNGKNGDFTLLFIFTKNPKHNDHYLEAVEAEGEVSQELKIWLSTKTNMRVPTH